jgi:MoaA/NifB/PqqE/SkfB family radical SAM enzyme
MPITKKTEKFITADKIFYHLDRLDTWLQGKAVYPITVEIHPSDFCNNKCYYCYYRKEKRFIGKKDFVKILKKLKVIDTKGIILSGGGEPLLNPEINDFLKLVKRNNFSLGLITNLNIYNKELFKNILECAEWCRVSLDASSRKTYKNIRMTDMFTTVLDNIKMLVKLRNEMSSHTTLGIQMVVCKENINEVFRFIKLASDLKIDYSQIRPLEILPDELNPYSRKDYEYIVYQYKKARYLETPFYKIIFSNKWDIMNPDHRLNSHGFTFCHGYPFIGAIDARGDFYICCHKVEKRDKRFCCGNIITESVKKIMDRRKNAMIFLNLKDCYLECRASNLNRKLEGLLSHEEHKNFL